MYDAVRHKRDAEIRRFLGELKGVEVEALSEMHISRVRKEGVGLFVCLPRNNGRLVCNPVDDEGYEKGLFWNDVLEYVKRKGVNALPLRLKNGRLENVERKEQWPELEGFGGSREEREQIVQEAIQRFAEAMPILAEEELAEKATGVLREKRNADIRRFLNGLKGGEAEALSEMHRSLLTRDQGGLFVCDPRAHDQATGLYWKDVLEYVLREGPEALPWYVNNWRLVRVESKDQRAEAVANLVEAFGGSREEREQSVNDAMQNLAAKVWTSNEEAIVTKGMDTLFGALKRQLAEDLSEKAEGVKVATEQPKPPKGATCKLTDEDMAAIMGINMSDRVKLRKPKQTYPEKLAADHWGYVDSLFAVHGVNEKAREVIGFHYKSAMVHGFKHGVEFALNEESENE